MAELHELARRIAESVDLPRVLIAELTARGGTRLRWVGAWPSDDRVPSDDLDATDEPWAEVLRAGSLLCPRDAPSRFPGFPALAVWNAGSFRAVRLADGRREGIGVLLAIGPGELPDSPDADRLLEAWAEAAAAELRRRRLDRELRESERRLRTMAENIPGLVHSYTIDESGRRRLLFVSGLEEMLGPETAAWLGEDVDRFRTELVHPDDREEFFEASRVAVETGEAFDEEYRVLTDGGVWRWVRAIGRPSPLEDGRVLWNGILIDITEWKEAQGRAAEYSAALIAANEALWEARNRPEAGSEAPEDPPDPDTGPLDDGPVGG